MINTVLHGDCLELMRDIPDSSVDMILCDLPYGTTACKWDIIIPFKPLWEQYKRIIKKNGAIVLFGSEPFSTYMRISNIQHYKYDWIWYKTKSAGFVHAKNMPIKQHETISVFSYGSMGHSSTLKDNRMNYNPQNLVCKLTKYKKKSGGFVNILGKRPSHKNEFVSYYTNYPTSILFFANENTKLHPTQKPVDLFEYLIKTYTNEGDTVLDNCAGSGTTAIACINSNRNYILMEKEEEYINIINKRIKEHTAQQKH